MRLFKNDAQMQLLHQLTVTVDAIVTDPQSKPDFQKDMELSKRLFEHQHYSPFEHQAMAVLESNLQETRNFTGWAQYRALIGG